MSVKLVVASRQHNGSEIQISKSQFVIGRHTECDLRVGSSKISNHHCAVLIRKNRVYIRDFDSTNGTFVNEDRVTADRELHDGDVVRIGSLHLRLEIGQSSLGMVGRSNESVAALMLADWPDDVESGVLGLGDSRADFGTDMRMTSLREKPEARDGAE